MPNTDGNGPKISTKQIGIIKLVSNKKLFSYLKVNQSYYRPEVPRGFQEVKVPRLRDNGPGWW